MLLCGGNLQNMELESYLLSFGEALVGSCRQQVLVIIAPDKDSRLRHDSI